MSTQKQNIKVKIDNDEFEGSPSNKIIQKEIGKASERADRKLIQEERNLILSYLKWGSGFVVVILYLFGALTIKETTAISITTQLDTIISFIKKRFSG
jgi:hypothetical protein